MSAPQGRRRRHVPQPNAQHVYWSQRANGTKVYEVRHPANGNGARMYETLPLGTALEQAKQRAREAHGVSAPRVVSVGTTLADVVADWRATRVMRPNSTRTFDTLLAHHIEPRFGRVKVRDITPSMIQAWLGGLQRKDGRDGALSTNTKRLVLSTLNLVLQHAVEMGALGAVPQVPRKRRPKQGESRRRILTTDEELRLLAYCAPSPWLRPIVKVALYQALRLGEVAALEWGDVDFGAGKLHVRRSLGRDGTLGPPKGGRAVAIPLTPAAREALLELRADSNDGAIFRNSLGERRQLRIIQRAFTTAVERAALKETEDGRVVFHSLRHTGISRLANHPRIPLVHVRDFARHAALATTQGYVHRIEDQAITDAFAEALAGAREAA